MHVSIFYFFRVPMNVFHIYATDQNTHCADRRY